MANLKSFKNQPENITSQESSWSVLSNSKKISIDEMLIKLEWNKSNKLENLRNILTWLKWLQNNHKNDLELLLWKYDYLDSTSWEISLLMFIWDLKSLNEKFEAEKEAIKNDAKKAQEKQKGEIKDSNASKEVSPETWETVVPIVDKRKEIIAPWELSDEMDWLWIMMDSIKEKFEKASSMNIEQIVWEIKKIEFDKKINIWLMDEHFEDLLNDSSLSETDKIELQSYIDEFKKKEFYKALQRGEKFDLGDINKFLDTQTDKIYKQTEPPFVVELWDNNKKNTYAFTDKKEALLAIYQTKLHLENTEPWVIGYILNEYTVTSWVALVALAGTIIGFYAKNKIIDKIDQVNQWINADDIKALANGNDWPLDELINQYVKYWLGDDLGSIKEIRNKITWIRTPHTSATEITEALSTVYRQLASFRSRSDYFFSSLITLDNPIDRKKWIKSSLKLLVWSVNHWPEDTGIRWWWWKTQLNVFNEYVEWFKNFTEMTPKIEKIMKDQGKNPNEIDNVIKKVLSLYKSDKKVPLIWRTDIKPFEDHFDEIIKILDDNNVVLSKFWTNLVKRKLKWEIEPDIKRKILEVTYIVKHHPNISDVNQKRIEYELWFFQHSEKLSDFESKTVWLLRPFLEIENFNDLLTNNKINIDEIYTLDDLTKIREAVKTNINNFSEVTNYLASTTEWHKWIICHNIALIINGKKPVDNIDIDMSREIVIDFKGLWLKNVVEGINVKITDTLKKIEDLNHKKQTLDLLDRFEIDIELKWWTVTNLYKSLRRDIANGVYSLLDPAFVWILPDLNDIKDILIAKSNILSDVTITGIRDNAKLFDEITNILRISWTELNELKDAVKKRNSIDSFEWKIWYAGFLKYYKKSLKTGF
jgi:hypothetical protein